MLEIAVDIGGTFTDIVCLQDQQRLFLAKVPTTPHDLVQGVQQGVTRVLALAGQPATAVERFIHSTTITTNAILEQKGAITGVLMTSGFKDVLEIGRQKRAQMYDYVGQSYELEVPLPEVLDGTCGAQAVAAFHAAHQQVYGHSRPTHAVEFVNLRSVHSAPLPRPQLTVPVPNRDTPIYQRDLLPLGAQFDDPAIVEQPNSTTVVYPGFTCRVDDTGNLLLTLHTR
jgi:N-methylhydantoinase A/oxoprolinase/acetone carboxylase beta subunit